MMKKTKNERRERNRGLQRRHGSPTRTKCCLGLGALFALSGAGVGCDKTVGEAVRPDAATAAQATGNELVCAETPTRIKPLVVDWQPDERVDLEAAMSGPVVVVKYDCPGIEILPGCSVDGVYAYAGVSRKEQVVQMNDLDQVRANIPIKTGSVGAELSAGRSINLATVYVGRHSTTVNHVTSGDLVGACEGATHFVRSASLGAFSMGAGTRGKAMVVAEMFGMGAGASSDSTRQSLNSDGSLESCRTSSPGDTAPPAECRAPVKIELMPIVAGEPGEGARAAAEALQDGEAVGSHCVVPGYVLVDGVCQSPSEDVAYVCVPTDAVACEAQCKKGSMESCYNWGLLQDEDLGAAQIPLDQACQGGVSEACARLGDMIWMATDRSSSRAGAMVETAHRMLVQACDDGVGYGCEVAGDIHSEKTLPSMHDERRAFEFYARACALGRNYGCYEQGSRLLSGDGVAADVDAGVDVWRRACDGGSADECKLLGDNVVRGRFGLGRKPEVGVEMFVAACSLEVDYCEDAAAGIGTLGGDVTLVVQAYEKDCTAYADSPSCGHLGALLVEGKGVAKDVERGRALLASACRAGHRWACDAKG